MNNHAVGNDGQLILHVHSKRFTFSLKKMTTVLFKRVLLLDDDKDFSAS